MTAVSGLSGIVDCREVYRGRSRSADLSAVPTYVRVFLVTTNVLSPNLRFVAAAPGIAWRSAHPDDVNSYLVESSTQQDGDSPFHYKVTYTYKYLDESELLPWNRPHQFTFNGSLASAPAFWHYPNEGENNTKQIIVNSAKDPLEGLDRDEAEFSVTIQLNIAPPFSYVKAQQYVGAINSDTWSGGLEKTWKCQGVSASRKVEVVAGTTPDAAPQKIYYWDVSITVAYRADTWDLRTWDVGFNQLVDNKRVKIYAGSEPVSEPVALNSNGTAKTPGLPPDMKIFRIYPKMPFSGVIPTIPNTAPTGYTYPASYWPM
jgi:hypothetical protein